MATKKISQLDSIADANISGEAIFPAVVSDPLIPNRKVKISQVFKGMPQGTKTAPGLCFDLDRDTGVYQNAYNQLGLSWGTGGVYFTRGTNSDGTTTQYITAVDSSVTNSNLTLAGKGTGFVSITGKFLISDSNFVIEDSQSGVKARFEIGAIGAASAVEKIFSLPAVTQSGTTLVGDDTEQTLRNKTILVDEDNFVITSGATGAEEAVFQIDWPVTTATRRSYYLPDGEDTTTTAEPNANHSTLLDTKSVQTSLNKTLVQLKLKQTFDSQYTATFNTSQLTANRTITVPNLNVTLVGEDATQTLSNKVYQAPIFAALDNITRKINFDLSNVTANTNETYRFPDNAALNNNIGYNVIVTERAQQTLRNKTFLNPTIGSSTGGSGQVVFNLDNLSALRTIRFPNADATLLSTDNVTLDDVKFGGGIGGSHLTGRTRQQQLFYSGF